jgi:hypothetical protein
VTIGLSSAINVTNHTPGASASEHNTAFGVNAHEGAASAEASAIERNSTLTFADRVAYQRAIEEVYWRHRTGSVVAGSVPIPSHRSMR